MGQNVDLDLDLDLTKAKHGHGRGQYLSDLDDFGLVEELRVRAFQRHQNHQKPRGIDPVQGLVLIWIQVQVRIFPGPCNQDILWILMNCEPVESGDAGLSNGTKIGKIRK